MRRLVAGFIFALALGFAPGLDTPAGAADQVSWDDLAPSMDDLVNPFDRLEEQAQNDLYDVYWVRDMRASGSKDPELNQIEEEALARLKGAGHDLDALMAEVEVFHQELRQRDETLVESLDGRSIRIPGYVLPLEFSGTVVTEFLLVPYVGACIHTPPPPVNQIVHVEATAGFQPQGLYTPVWVTGRMSTTLSTQSLTFVDGTSDISVGYGLEAVIIEPYTE